ncbi:MAG: hypothetical protein ACOYMR_01135 [Ilumatobacteraceae bacterium]
MNITAAQFIAENLERRQHDAADRRALRREATALTPANPHGRTPRVAHHRRAWFRLRTPRVAHS